MLPACRGGRCREGLDKVVDPRHATAGGRETQSSRNTGVKPTVSNLRGNNRAITLVAIAALIAVIGAIAAFAYLTRVEQHVEAYIARATEMQVLGQKVVKSALASSRGDEAAFERLRADSDRFATLQDQVRSGAPELGLPAAPAELAEPVDAVERAWRALRAPVDAILENQADIVALSRTRGRDRCHRSGFPTCCRRRRAGDDRGRRRPAAGLHRDPPADVGPASAREHRPCP
jgi:hypothetical protein